MTKIEIKDYLENYRDRKTIAEFKLKQGDADHRIVICVKAIEDCLQSLPDGLGEILRMIYIERKSLRKISAQHYYCKDTIAKRRDEALAVMEVCLSDI